MKRKILKPVAILLALVFCLSFASCASNESAIEEMYLGVTDYILSDGDILRLNAETTQESLDALAVGDTVVLGKYDLDNTPENGNEDIVWKVLAIENGKALIISELCIDAMTYGTEQENITWETSALR